MNLVGGLCSRGATQGAVLALAYVAQFTGAAPEPLGEVGDAMVVPAG
jgi:hypothetical protein